jgi:asparagine synthase (glutamine-hydrolysing)
MCGICGFVDDTGRRADLDVLIRMRETLQHRGPDGAGHYIDGALGLAHRRLSIIDPLNGRQPMQSDDGALTVVFNGEIYNYVELGAELAADRPLRTASDTEVILRAFERFGPACVERFNGMFAIAIWDRRARRLWLARDRAGVKPLYYTIQGGTFAFASEIKSLLAHPAIGAEVEPEAVDEFMTYGYVQSPRTIVRGIYRVPEGHTLTWQSGRIELQRYWQQRFEPDETIADADHERNLRELLDDSIRLRLRSDVPIGVLLSGGVDSSAVAALLARKVGRIKTFSVGFARDDHGDQFNELRQARMVADAIGSEHHELVVDERQFCEFMPQLAYYMDEPVTEAAAVPLYFLSALAAQHVKVVLSGEGADELFGGYPVYRRMQLMARYRRLVPGAARRLLAAGAHALNDDARVDKYLALACEPLEQSYLNAHLYDLREREQLYRPEYLNTLGGRNPRRSSARLFVEAGDVDDLSRMLYVDARSWLPNDILIKSDRMSMAASIELRVPFLDYRLIEYAARIPSRLKIRRGVSKWILKRAVRDLLPAAIVARGKMGFPTPIGAMLRGSLAPYMRDLLGADSAIARGYFRPAVVERLITEHVSGQASHESMLWRLVVLEQWHRQFASGRWAGAAATLEPATARVQAGR